MRRVFASLFAAGLALGLSSSPAPALMIAIKSPAESALAADAVVIGKVTAIEKEAIEAVPFPGAPNKLQYKIAVVQVQTALAGANNVTHIKVGFIPPPPAQPNQPGLVRPPIRRGNVLPELKEGQEFVFFLTKHPESSFFVMPNMSPPLDVKAEETKMDIESLKKVLAVVADPMKALKSDKADARAFAAAVLIAKYRVHPGVEEDQVPIPADESKLILKGLTETDWAKLDRAAPSSLQAFYKLELTDKDGWVAPKAQPPMNHLLLTKAAFEKWLEGPGKDYTIKRIVPKKK